MMGSVPLLFLPIFRFPINQRLTVTFNVNGGSAVAPQTGIASGVKATKEANIFEGWYKEAALTTAWNFATNVVTANTTLYAKWTEEEVTGVEDNEWEGVTLYPNPARDITTLSGLQSAEIISLFDMSGRLGQTLKAKTVKTVKLIMN